MPFNSFTLDTYGITVVTFTAAGVTNIDEDIVFEQDAEILSVFVQKPAGGGTSLDVTIEPQPPIARMNPLPAAATPPLIIPLGNLSLGAADTSLQFQDPTPLKSGARIKIVTAGAVAGDKGIVMYVRVLPGRGRGM